MYNITNPFNFMDMILLGYNLRKDKWPLIPLMAYICGTMPDRLKRLLLPCLLLAFGEESILEEKDSVKDTSFQTLHFSWYNRHATQGHDAPSEIDLYMMERTDRRANHSQFIPYMSAEMETHQVLYESFSTMFAEVFEWIRQHLSTFLPGEYEMLATICNLLTGNNQSVVEPFLSLVINLNISTLGHRDGKDKDFCLVLPIGDFTGGEMVMKEPGLVVELLQGNWIVFASADTTHFNTPYQGRRASLVFHSDRAMDQWARDRNGWEDHPSL